MPRSSTKIGSLLLIPLVGLMGTSAFAQGAPTDIPGVILVCAPVISEEYDGERTRWGQCVASVKSFLNAIGTPAATTDATVTDLVIALTELYEDDLENCLEVETELPEAIQLAAERVTIEEQQAQILEISYTIAECAQFATAAIELPAPAASAF